jgi:peptidoglycan/xylan/chitin deacetylase (PgdA/CDA1 family)
VKPELVVLCYHGVSDSWPEQTAVTLDDLAAHVDAFLRRGYRGTTFTDALTTPRFARTVAITFDDAATSVFEQAAPLLAECGVPGTVFVPTDFPDQDKPMAWPGLDRWVGGQHERELRCMSWGQLGQLAEAGWEIGSHTCSHPHLTELGEVELSRELAESKRECEYHLGGTCPSLAYPYSDVDARVAGAAWAVGYGVAATVPVGSASPLPLLWPRVGAYRGESARRIWLRARRRALPLF